MKKTWILLILYLFAGFLSINAQVAINNDNPAPHGSAILDVKSTEKGILFSRMSAEQCDAITGPRQRD